METLNHMTCKIKELFKENFKPANKSRKAGRILYLDVIKIFAAFMVVFYHFSYYKMNYGFVAGEIYSPNFTRILMCIASASVPLFFMVNGSLILGRDRTVKNLIKKILKIIILIIVWSPLGLPSWFFKTLCILYILVPIIRYTYKNNKVFFYLLAGLVFVFPFLFNYVALVLKYLDIKELSMFSMTLPLTWINRTGAFTMYSILYFMLGLILLNSKKRPIILSIIFAALGLLLVVTETVIYTNLNNEMFDGVNASFPTIGALFLSIGIFELAKKINFEKLKGIVIFLSGGVMHVFLMHMFIIGLAVKYIPLSKVYSLPLAIAASAAVYVCCVFAGKIIERIPIACWFIKM